MKHRQANQKDDFIAKMSIALQRSIEKVVLSEDY